eukprot:768845-Ditylum_brightwellii.AAC.1
MEELHCKWRKGVKQEDHSRGKCKRGKKSRAMKLQCTGAQAGDSTSEERKANTNNVVRANKLVTKENGTLFCFRTILNSGTDWIIVGKPDWSVCKTFQDKLTISAVDGKGIYSPDLTKDEAVVNNHLCCEAGWQLDCVAKHHGGLHSIWFPNADTIPLEYDTIKYKMYLPCCCPTQKELATIPIQWIDCHLEDLEIDKGNHPIRRKPRGVIENKVQIPGGTDEMDTAERPGNNTMAEDLSDKKEVENSMQKGKEKMTDLTKALETETEPSADPNPDVQ